MTASSCDDGGVLGVTVVSDLARANDPRADPRNVAMIARRHALFAALARLRGWDLVVRDAASLSDERGRLAWIDLPMLPRARYRDVFARAEAAGAASVSAAPSDVERVLGLDAFYPVLKRAGVPTPRTALLPLGDDIVASIDAPAAVRRLLTESIYGAMFDAGLDPHEGVYVRGFYSSAKSANPEHYFGDNQADIEATAFEVIRRLRAGLEVGGLALREHLDLERIELPATPGERDEIRLPFEIRLTVLGGRAIMASYHGPFDMLIEGARGALGEALRARRGQVLLAARTLVPRLLAASLPESYVADVAFTKGGEAVVLELNPLYAAGTNVPCAHAVWVATIGADLARRASLAELSWPEVLSDATALAGEPVGEGAGLWLFEPTMFA